MRCIENVMFSSEEVCIRGFDGSYVQPVKTKALKHETENPPGPLSSF